MYIVRRDAISDLARNGDSGALEVILSVRGDKEKIIRRKIAEVLEKFDSDRSRIALCEYLSDTDEDVRRNAIRSLKKIGDASCIPPIEKATQDKAWFVKRSAEDTLKILMKKFPDGPKEAPKPPGKPRERKPEEPHKPVVRQRMPAEKMIPVEPRYKSSAAPEKKEPEKKEPTRLTATAASVLAQSETGFKEKEKKSVSELQAEIASLRDKHKEMLDEQDRKAAERARRASSMKSPKKTEKERRRPTERKPSRRAAASRTERPKASGRVRRDDMKIRKKTKPSRTVEPERHDRGASKMCPTCGSKVKQHHRVCLFCGHTFGRTARERAKRELKQGLGAPRRTEAKGLTGKFMMVLLTGGAVVVDQLADLIGATRGLPRNDAIQKLSQSSGIISDDLQPNEVKRLGAILGRASIEFFVQPSDRKHAVPRVESIRRGKVDKNGPDFILQSAENVKSPWNNVLLVTCGLIRPGGNAFMSGPKASARTQSTRFVMDFYFREPYLITRIVRKMPNLGAIQRMIHRRKEDYFEQLADEVAEHGVPGRLSRGLRIMARDGFRGNFDDIIFDNELDFTNHGLWLLEVLEYETSKGTSGRVPHLNPIKFRVSDNPEHNAWKREVRERRKHTDYRDIVRRDHKRDRRRIGWGESKDLLKWTSMFGEEGQQHVVRIMAVIVIIIIFFGMLGAMCS
jgi:hypothetical protein